MKNSYDHHNHQDTYTYNLSGARRVSLKTPEIGTPGGHKTINRVGDHSKMLPNTFCWSGVPIYPFLDHMDGFPQIMDQNTQHLSRTKFPLGWFIHQCSSGLVFACRIATTPSQEQSYRRLSQNFSTQITSTEYFTVFWTDLHPYGPPWDFIQHLGCQKSGKRVLNLILFRVQLCIFYFFLHW